MEILVEVLLCDLLIVLNDSEVWRVMAVEAAL